MKGLPSLVILVGLLTAVRAYAQEALPLDAFFGRWEGSAIGQDAAESTLGYGIRDLDVRISGTADGLEITWFTVPRAGSLAGPEAETERRSTTVHFAPAGPSVWLGEAAEGPGADFSRSWARLDGRSLYVYVLEVDELGIYQLSRYERTISAAGVMDLRFTRDKDGRTVRRVTGSLLRAGD